MDHTPGRALDEYLVSLSQAGSSEALDGLARRWTPRLLRYAAAGTVKSRLHHARDALKRQLNAAAAARNEGASRKRGIS
jgi:hypothetical protein